MNEARLKIKKNRLNVGSKSLIFFLFFIHFSFVRFVCGNIARAIMVDLRVKFRCCCYSWSYLFCKLFVYFAHSLTFFDATKMIGRIGATFSKTRIFYFVFVFSLFFYNQIDRTHRNRYAWPEHDFDLFSIDTRKKKNNNAGNQSKENAKRKRVSMRCARDSI